MVRGVKQCLESNPIPARNAWKAQTKPCVLQDPETTQETDPDLPFSGMGQQWPAAGTGALAATDQGGMVYNISPLGGGCHQPHHRATEQMTHKLENNYTKDVLALLQKF